MTKPYIKGYKFRIYPNKEQMRFLANVFGCNRFVYNYMLEWHNKVYKNEKRCLHLKEMNAMLPVLKKQEETKWLGAVIAQSLQMSVKDLENAFNRYFKKVSAHPTFKSKYDRQCFKIPQNFKFKDGKIKIPKLDSWIKVHVSLEEEGKILYMHISKTPTDKYYVSLTVAGTKKTFEKTGKQAGIDLGIKEAVILSDGTIYKNIKAFKSLEKKLAYEQRQLAKKQKGSNSRQRQRKKVALLHERIANMRKDFISKITTEIVKNHDTLCAEDLAVANLIKNHKLAKSLADVSLGRIRTELKYKCAWHDRVYIEIDRFYPSSKTCSGCGWIKQDLTLADRSWTCQSCGAHHDRDINAAKNILAEGLKIMSGCGTQSEGKPKQVEASSLEESAKPDKPKG
jgi:putative transposase